MTGECVPGRWRYRDAARLGPVWKMTCLARCYTKLAIEGLSHEHLLETPERLDTNILWNLGHVTFSHDQMLYGPSGSDSPLPSYFEKYFRPGVTPSTWDRTPDIEEVMKHFNGQLARIERDLKAGAFARYVPVKIAVGVRVRSLEEALSFNAAHEGFHAGVISTVRDQVAGGGHGRE